jgi:hypothetical protein
MAHAKTKKTLIFEQKKLNYFRARKKKGGGVQKTHNFINYKHGNSASSCATLGGRFAFKLWQRSYFDEYSALPQFESLTPKDY